VCAGPGVSLHCRFCSELIPTDWCMSLLPKILSFSICHQAWMCIRWVFRETRGWLAQRCLPNVHCWARQQWHPYTGFPWCQGNRIRHNESALEQSEKTFRNC
jgi:hypothetical protein